MQKLTQIAKFLGWLSWCFGMFACGLATVNGLGKPKSEIEYFAFAICLSVPAFLLGWSVYSPLGTAHLRALRWAYWKWGHGGDAWRTRLMIWHLPAMRPLEAENGIVDSRFVLGQIEDMINQNGQMKAKLTPIAEFMINASKKKEATAYGKKEDEKSQKNQQKSEEIKAKE